MLMTALKQSKTRNRTAQAGFSLLEMAVVMVIIGLLLGGLLTSLGSTREINARTDAENQLNQIIEALYGYAQANGRLPCPSTVASAGAEAPLGGGNCTQQHGFVPSETLGLSGSVNADGLLMDPWQGAYRYSVSTSNGNAFTTSNRMRTVTMANLTPDLRVCDAAACGTVTADSLPVVVLSMGADWADFTGADVDATENAGETTIAGYRHANDNDFVSTTYIEDVFDDMITWMSPNILFTRMISAGQLP